MRPGAWLLLLAWAPAAAHGAENLATESPPAVAPEADEITVSLRVPASRSGLLDEVVLRIRAELGSAGFVTQVIADDAAAEPGTAPAELAGTLQLSENGSWVQLAASTPEVETPISQSIDASRPGISAEVIAVRAVEALRAALLQSLRTEGSASAAAAPSEVVRRFARLPAEPPASVPAAPPPEPAPPAPPEPAAEGPWHLYATVAPLVRFESFEATPALGSELQLGAEYEWLRVGALLDATFLAARLATPAGDIAIRELSAALRLGVSGDFGGWNVQGGVALGAVNFALNAEPNAGYSGSSAEAASALVQLDAALGYWLSPHAGPVCAARLASAWDAPVLSVEGSEVARLARPSLCFSCGLALRF